MVTGVGWGPLECYDGNRGRLRLRSTRAAMLATVNATITQQITLYLSDQYYLRYHDFTMKTKN